MYTSVQPRIRVLMDPRKNNILCQTFHSGSAFVTKHRIELVPKVCGISNEPVQANTRPIEVSNVYNSAS